MFADAVVHTKPYVLALAACAVVACGRDTGERGRLPTAYDSLATRDDFGHELIETPARRIVSLNPATTDIVFALGGGPRLVGRTTWDTYPDSLLLVPDMGAGVRPNVEVVLAARPDLVLLYASADNRPAADRLRAAGIATISLKVDRIADFRRAAQMVARAMGDASRGRAAVDSVDRTLSRVRAATASLQRPSALWHVWDAPLVTIGAGSFMSELLEIAGARNVYADIAAPSPQVAMEDVIRRDPDVIIAGPDGAAHIRADARWRSLRAVRGGKVVVVDTMLVARPSVRLGEAAVSLARLLHPGSM